MNIQSMLGKGRFTICSFNSKYLHKSVLSGWRGRPYATANAAVAAASEEPNPNGRKVGKKVPKAERQAMLESFVSKYRATNSGKFPTISIAKKEVGGSFYVVRRILQELEYTAKMSPAYGIGDSSGQEEVKENELLTEVEENSTSEMPAYASVQNDSEATYDIDLSDSSGRHLEAKEESHTLSSVEILSVEVITPGSGSDHVAMQSNMLKEDAGEFSYKGLDKLGNAKEEAEQSISDSIALGCQMLQDRFEVVSHPCDKSENSKTDKAQADQHDFVAKEKHLPIGDTNRASHPSFDDTEDKIKQQDALGGLPGFDDSKGKTEQYAGIPQPDNLPKDLSGRQADNAEPPKKSTLWGNMKSFADGIISIWRKL